MSWVDWVLLGTLAVSVLLGLWRGLVYEVMALAGWVVAYFGCPVLAPLLAPMLPAQRLDSSLLHGLSLVLAFMLILLVWGLAAKLLRSLIHATPLNIVDRLLGGGFGALRGLLIVLLVTVGVVMTPAVRSQAWQESAVAPWLQAALRGLSPLLPDDVVKFMAV